MRWVWTVAIAALTACQFGSDGGPSVLGSGVVADTGDTTGSAINDTTNDAAASAGPASSGGQAGGAAGDDEATPDDTGPPADSGVDETTDSGPPAPSSSSGDETTGPEPEPGTSTGPEPGPEPYVSCAGGCPADAPVCVDLGGASFCSEACVNASTCPTPSSGTANVICSSIGVCALDCALLLCPTGMDCLSVGDLFGPYRCGWAN